MLSKSRNTSLCHIVQHSYGFLASCWTQLTAADQDLLHKWMLSWHKHILCLEGSVSKQQIRRASYINPKFEGGKAKPHGEMQIMFIYPFPGIFYITLLSIAEFGKNVRQKLFEKGELFFSIPVFIVLGKAAMVLCLIGLVVEVPFIPATYVVFGPTTAHHDEFQQDRFDEWRTIYNYPC